MSVAAIGATSGEACEIELGHNAYQGAIFAATDRSRRYRILFAQHECQLLVGNSLAVLYA